MGISNDEYQMFAQTYYHVTGRSQQRKLQATREEERLIAFDLQTRRLRSIATGRFQSFDRDINIR